MWKKGICFVLGIIGTFNVVVACAEELEVSEWALDYYEYSLENQLLPEYMLDYDFTQYINREQFCDLVYTTLKKGRGEGENTDEDINVFIDTDSKSVMYLYEKKIIYGKSYNEFCPNDYLTREEAAVIIYRARNYYNKDEREPMNVLFYYDEDKISNWAQKAVFRLKEWGWMTGITREIFSPQQKISPEEVMKLNTYMYKNLCENKTEPVN